MSALLVGAALAHSCAPLHSNQEIFAQSSARQFTVASDKLVEERDALIAFRHDLHRHPEIAGQERRTAGKVAAALESSGWDVRTGVGGHGVVGILRGASDGPTIAFRADMDAVLSDAPDPVPYASVIEGVRHICGHDMHTAIGIGLAKALSVIRNDLDGTVMLVFQPAEETGTGADAMLADGLFDDLQPDAILALHTFPSDIGVMAAMPHGMMAGRSLVEVDLTGDGNMENAAEAYRKALLGTATVTGPAELEPAPDGFIAVNMFQNEVDQNNSTARVRGLVMAAGLERREYVRNTIENAVRAVDVPGVSARISYSQLLEGVNNDPTVLQTTNRGIERHAADVTLEPLTMAIPAFSEDFGSMQKHVPGVMYFLGVNNPETGTIGFPHRPDYVADDKAIEIGARAMLAAILELTYQDSSRFKRGT